MTSLHVIGGSLRNRSLKTPKGDQTRPTTAILRKAVFDIVRPYIEGATFLDLFAGSGAMGIEALSCGASHATFIDQNRSAIQCIRENLQSLKIENKATVIQGSAVSILKRLYPNNLKSWDFGLAKASGLDDRKRVHISNIEPFTIVQSRELSLKPKPNSSGCLGIQE